MDAKYSNSLSNETSLYLLQHANNPVNWLPWGDKAFDLAKQQNKLMLISIGYSSCHWCHVMEKEVFSNEEVAQIMNEHFVCVKVDREERPDVDQIYMNAVRIITRSGGWPLNCFALPNGQPIFGGTYFPKDNWIDILQSLNATWKSDSERVVEVANELTQGVSKSEIIEMRQEATKGNDSQFIADFLTNWEKYFDDKYGGTKGAPKFPMPGSIEFLLRQSALEGNDSLKEYVKKTLDRVSAGGINDHLGGGFFRYSVDERWEVPHFEKMLYDNAQLLQLYSVAYSVLDKDDYKSVAYDIFQFLIGELLSPEGGFYGSIDADSEGGEGAYYTWSCSEVESVLKGDKNLFTIVYGVSAEGNHQGKSTLRKCANIGEAACILGLDLEQSTHALAQAKVKMLEFRQGRPKPATDDKVVTSWNALLITALTHAYISFNDQKFLELAIQTMGFIEKFLLEGNDLKRIRCKGISKIDGFLDDYSMLVEAYIALHMVTLDETWLEKANRLVQYAIDKFHDSGSGMFFYAKEGHDNLIVRKMELTDGVLPSSSAVMAENLFVLGNYFRNQMFLDISAQMLTNMQQQMVGSGPFVFRWAKLLQKKLHPIAEVGFAPGFSNKDLGQLLKQMQYYPNIYPYLAKEASRIPIVCSKLEAGYYRLCLGKQCLAPNRSIHEVIEAISER